MLSNPLRFFGRTTWKHLPNRFRHSHGESLILLVAMLLSSFTICVALVCVGKALPLSSLQGDFFHQHALKCLKPALSMCHPNSVSSRVVLFVHLQTMADSCFPHGQRYYTKSGYFAYLDDATIDRLLAAMVSLPSAETQIELAYLGGAASRVHANETAFGDRSAPFITNLLANWSEASADDAHISWVRGLFNKLRPSMKPGVYVNFMSGDEQDRVQEAYRTR